MVLIFDMDGVIVDNHKYHFDAWLEFGKKHGINITREEFGKHFGSTNQMIMTSLFGADISDSRILELAREKEAIYREMYSPFIKPVSGLPEFLKFASGQNIPVALATSAPSENVKFTLEATGLETYFNLITDSSMIGRGKPDPEVYLITAGKLGVKPSECIVFEDAVPGIISAKSAGMRVIGVATTHKSEELLMYVNEIIMNFDAPHKLMEKLLHPTVFK
jgi:HAD superfamily hydrolase (TIGR01549 family)